MIFKSSLLGEVAKRKLFFPVKHGLNSPEFRQVWLPCWSAEYQAVFPPILFSHIAATMAAIADVFAEILRESQVIRSLLQKLSESISTRKLDEAVGIFLKLIDLEPRKHYALHAVVKCCMSFLIDAYISFTSLIFSRESQTIWQ